MRLQKINKTLKEFDHFTGGPNDKFAEVALATFYSLTVLGLTPAKTLLDIGCGALRNGFLLMNYLDAGNYYGVEPNTGMLDEGKEKVVAPFLDAKTPHFSHTDQFDFAGSFPDTRFDFALARSIFTHASKAQIDLCISELARVSHPGTIFLLSFLPPKTPDDPEYDGDAWLGRSHLSDTPGIAHYRKKTLIDMARPHGFEPLPGAEKIVLQAVQEWLVLRRA